MDFAFFILYAHNVLLTFGRSIDVQTTSSQRYGRYRDVETTFSINFGYYILMTAMQPGKINE